MCVDPHSKKTFKINIGTQEAQEVVLRSHRDISNKINREVYKIDELLDRNEHEGNWNFQNEAVQEYRRRMVPFYLLEGESPQFPVYIDNSNIDSTLIEDRNDRSPSAGITIENVHINMSEGMHNIPFNLSKVSLLTTADDLIQMCERMIVKQNKLTDATKVQNMTWKALKKDAMKPDYMTSVQFSNFTGEEQETVRWLIELQKQQNERDGQEIPLLDGQYGELDIMGQNNNKQDDLSNRKSMLKFKNFDSYLYGETQLVYFVELRKYLATRRGDKDKPLELVFLSLSADDLHQQPGEVQKRGKEPTYEFPPLLNVSDRHHLEGTSVKTNTPQGRFGSSIASQITRRHSSMKIEKPIEESVASRFRHVSIFSWYPPKRLPEESVSKQETQFVRKSAIGNKSPQIFGYQKEIWQIMKKQQHQGNNSFLKYPGQGYFTYQAEGNILPSCDVYEPLKIKLLGVKNLSQSLQRFVNKGKTTENPQTIPIMTYCEPAAETNSAVLDFLKDCADTGIDRAAIKNTLRPKLINPFANHGKNAHYTLGFSEIKFLLNKPHGKIKGKKLKEAFSFEPRYIQIQAALYLGCRRISCFSYSKPALYGNTIELENDTLSFWKPINPNKLQKQKEQAQDMVEPEIRGEMIDIACLPSLTRLCMNVIVLPEKGSCKNIVNPDKTIQKKDDKKRIYNFTQKEGFVFGSIQMSLFEENFLLKQGQKEVRIWPFEEYNPRNVCSSECYLAKDSQGIPITKSNSGKIMKMSVEFQAFSSQVGWKLQEKDNIFYGDPGDEEKVGAGPIKINKDKKKLGELTKVKSFVIEQKEAHKQQTKDDLVKKTKTLQQVKKLLDVYPMDIDEREAQNIEFGQVLEHSNFIYKLPVFIRLIDFTNHIQVNTCYNLLESSNLGKDMTPEEALALLDGEFGDVRVRIFAVQKLAELSDLQIALFMPQLVQALKYEVFHHSPLAEFLLEKALSNTRVVGHAFFWALRACLARPNLQDIFGAATNKKEHEKEQHEKEKEQARVAKRLGPYLHSQERFFLILERFLLCCGQFKNDIFKQDLVNRECINLSNFIIKKLNDKNVSKTIAKKLMHHELKKSEIRIKLLQQLVIAHGRYDDLRTDRGVTLRRADTHNDKFIQHDDTGNQLDFERSRNHTKHNSTMRQQRNCYQFNINNINKFISDHVEDIFTAIQEERDYKKLIYQTQVVDWRVELMYVPFSPKEPISAFAQKGGTIFMSKKKPLLIVCQLANEAETEAALKAQYQYKNDAKQNKAGSNALINEQIALNNSQLGNSQLGNSQLKKSKQGFKVTQMENDSPPLKFMFKSGDDLRQDNLVLQFFKIMDRIWQSTGLDMAMICYDVMESGFETGYIEFVDNATVITEMHKQHSTRMLGPFNEQSMINYFVNHIAKAPAFSLAPSKNALRNKLEAYHSHYLNSLAGQCVATYVLGIRDRHPGNFMLQNETGKFFHIDFGHFLGHGKAKLGFKRDREPFILSREMQYFLKYFGQIAAEQEKSQEPQLETHIGEVKSSRQLQFKLTFEEPKGGEGQARRPPEFYEEAFEARAIKAFLEIRRNADIFVNLLTLMLVCDLEELDQPSIDWMKRALFLDVSEEEATVNFRAKIGIAKRQWYRQYDNLFHIISDDRKDAKLEKREVAAEKAEKKAKMAQEKGQ